MRACRFPSIVPAIVIDRSVSGTDVLANVSFCAVEFGIRLSVLISTDVIKDSIPFNRNRAAKYGNVQLGNTVAYISIIRFPLDASIEATKPSRRFRFHLTQFSLNVITR